MTAIKPAGRPLQVRRKVLDDQHDLIIFHIISSPGMTVSEVVVDKMPLSIASPVADPVLERLRRMLRAAGSPWWTHIRPQEIPG